MRVKSRNETNQGGPELGKGAGDHCRRIFVENARRLEGVVELRGPLSKGSPIGSGRTLTSGRRAQRL